MRLNICVSQMAPFGPFGQMAPFGPFGPIIKGKTPFDSKGSKGGLSTRGEAIDSPVTNNVFLIARWGFRRRLRVFSYTVWCVNGGGQIYSESAARVRSALGQARRETACFFVCVGLN